MNTIKVKISFKRGTCTVSGINLVTNDYASTKISFKFDDNSGSNLFTLLDPTGAPVYSDYIVNNEVPLYRMVDVTTEHSGKTYVKYTDSSDNIYWYNATDNELYDDEWSSVSPFDIDDYTKVQVKGTLFTTKGAYKFEVVKYVDDSKLTSVSGVIKVRNNLIQLDEFAVPYLSIFDSLMTEIENIDISATKSGKVCTLTINKKDGSTETVTINDGEQGEQGVPGPKGDSGVWIGQYEPLDGDYNVWIDPVSTPGTIPTKVSELTNDAGYITNSSVPTKTSDLTNDSGYITSSSLPTKLSDFTNDVGYITEGDIPTKTSDLVNDSGFINNSVNNLTNYYDKSTTDGKVKDYIPKENGTLKTNKVYYNMSSGVGQKIFRKTLSIDKTKLITLVEGDYYYGLYQYKYSMGLKDVIYFHDFNELVKLSQDITLGGFLVPAQEWAPFSIGTGGAFGTHDNEYLYLPDDIIDSTGAYMKYEIEYALSYDHESLLGVWNNGPNTTYTFDYDNKVYVNNTLGVYDLVDSHTLTVTTGQTTTTFIYSFSNDRNTLSLTVNGVTTTFTKTSELQ